MRLILVALLLCLISAIPRAAAATKSNTEEPVPLQYVNEDVHAVILLYEKLTGFKIVRDNFVQGKITVTTDQPVSRATAIELIEKALMSNGYALVQTEKDIVQIVGSGQNPRTVGLPLISDLKDVPKGERVISYMFKLRHLDPTQLQQVLGQYLSPPRPYTSFLALPDARAILVTERTSVIRPLVAMVLELDVPPLPPPARPPKEKDTP